MKSKSAVGIDEFRKSMKGIYSSSVMESTIDESPMVYKPMEEIMENIKDTVDIVKVIVYCLKFFANMPAHFFNYRIGNIFPV